MKITRVKKPGLIRHGLNNQVYDLAGSFYLLEIYELEDIKAILKDSDVIEKMRKRWTQAYRNFRDEKGERLQYFFHPNKWWNLLMRLSTGGEFSVEEFLSFVKFKSSTKNNLEGKDAYRLISFLFKKCLDSSTWGYQSNGLYAARRQNFKIEIVVPPEQYASLQGYSMPKLQNVLDQFHELEIELNLKKPF